MRQLSQNKAPFDGSVAKNVESFQNDMNSWMSDMQSGKREVGFVDVTFSSVPYAGAAAS